MDTLRRHERRRTLRVSLQIPLKVQSKATDGETATYQAFTQEVSGDGALLTLDAPVLPGDLVVLTNEATSETAKCFVTCVREGREPRNPLQRFVGVGFAFPDSNLWHMAFPEAGTRRATRSPETGALMNHESHAFRRFGN
jgi:hypothetical protein